MGKTDFARHIDERSELAKWRAALSEHHFMSMLGPPSSMSAKQTAEAAMPNKRVTPFASTELALKHPRNKLYTELVLQELAIQE